MNEMLLGSKFYREEIVVQNLNSKVIYNLEEILKFEQTKQCLNKWSGLKFQKAIPFHEEKLMRLWSNLMGDRQLKARETQEWIEIGF